MPLGYVGMITLVVGIMIVTLNGCIRHGSINKHGIQATPYRRCFGGGGRDLFTRKIFPHMSKLLLISGQFWKDGHKVAPAFGDKEQIALMTAYDSMMNEGTEPYPAGDPRTEEIIGWQIECFCGKSIIFEHRFDMNGDKKRCQCGLIYVCHEDDMGLVIKLKPKKL